MEETRSPSPEDINYRSDTGHIMSLSTDDLQNMENDEIRLVAFSQLENIYLAAFDYKIKSDPVRKAALCRIAAIGDYPPAVNEYANMLFAGRGVLQNKREALNYYLKSLEQKHEASITFLFKLLKEETLINDFNVLVCEYDAIRRQVQDAYSNLERSWANEI